MAAHAAWAIEGCYADLIEAAARACDELVLLNPGVDVCVANRPAAPLRAPQVRQP